MSLPRALHTAALSLWWHCRDCDAAEFVCPGCAEPLHLRRPAEHPPALPLHRYLICPDCGAALAVNVTGYRPNPTGEAPAGWPLAVASPPPAPARRRPAPAPARPAAVLPAAEPCPAAAARHRLSRWQALGWVPDGVEPSALAAAYRRRFRVEPRRDRQHKASRAYTLRELGLSLGELGLAPPPDPLAVIWKRALRALDLPSIRMLLSQQARLLALEPSPSSDDLLARVAAPANWLAMVAARITPLAEALTAATGQPVAVELVEVAR